MIDKAISHHGIPRKIPAGITVSFPEGGRI
jgi:hypothetical protein